MTLIVFFNFYDIRILPYEWFAWIGNSSSKIILHLIHFFGPKINSMESICDEYHIFLSEIEYFCNKSFHSSISMTHGCGSLSWAHKRHEWNEMKVNQFTRMHGIFGIFQSRFLRIWPIFTVVIGRTLLFTYFFLWPCFHFCVIDS